MYLKNKLVNKTTFSVTLSSRLRNHQIDFNEEYTLLSLNSFIIYRLCLYHINSLSDDRISVKLRKSCVLLTT